ncbi:hypothetical protein LV779_14660 [Streptomyces thinghirensis]|nr:hypothetical protein [Streptomyces thinghirensis]
MARLRTLLPEPAAAAPTPVPRREPRLPEAMDVFGIHADLISEYKDFTKSATVIRDARIGNFVEEDLAAKSQWPDPLAVAEPILRRRRSGHRPRAGRCAASEVRGDLPGRQEGRPRRVRTAAR